MMKRAMSVAAAGMAALSLVATPAVAHDSVEAANRADAQCLTLFLTAFGLDETNMSQEDKMGGTVLIGYYLGKIEARTPGFALEPMLLDILTNDMATEAQIEGIATRCGEDAMVMAERMTSVGNSMSKPAE